MPMFFLNINKAKGMTSFDVIYKLRKILNIKKIGHSGTLDPLATGVMQVGVGSAAKLLDYLDSDKCYVARAKFGFISDTYDDEGEKTFVKNPDFTIQTLKENLNTFRGENMQIPPKFSAIKINGQKLCDLARAGKELPEIKARKVDIYDIKLLEFIAPDEAEIFVHCSSGTYIRSLIYDLGQKLGCGAYMSELKRTKAGTFKIEDSITLNDNILPNAINPINALNLNKYELNEQQYKKVRHGNPIECEPNLSNDKKYMLIFNNKLVSIANLSDNILKSEKVFETE